ncbi:DUF4259 domain-containing protein [Actinacidiphila oryziradicis]|uniref:DUF4259 domain-containing protein n=1 Tax=Actinacidiphila oryziradicis TaxID=2571141 RepID=A0A4U0SP89_9ACTN|nr:DUF4259 domain-containing protein [Actinacidiphila oryziradicis]MCW2875631.1 hypothetical protein [Actinacidiphila oryziradicis]TKA11058.1 DUF4259 domain-containing protein [Actinacidiphila oryziradicis]
MGTWDVGPFDNDRAADFVGDLDELPEQERIGVLRSALATAAGEAAYLADDEAVIAIAAAAIVSAAMPGGTPIDWSYGPEQPIPQLPHDFAALAVQALDRVLGDECETKDLWEHSGAGQEWLEGVDGIRQTLRSAAEAGLPG